MTGKPVVKRHRYFAFSSAKQTSAATALDGPVELRITRTRSFHKIGELVGKGEDGRDAWAETTVGLGLSGPALRWPALYATKSKLMWRVWPCHPRCGTRSKHGLRIAGILP